jgi:CubicO group peptidase (beta-lactamase class C family)
MFKFHYLPISLILITFFSCVDHFNLEKDYFHFKNRNKIEDSYSLDSVLSIIKNELKIPAINYAVVDSDKIKRIRILGYKNNNSLQPSLVEDLFDLNSITKSFTGLLIVQLISEGKLSLSNKIADILPELSKVVHPDYKSITLENILTHRAGFSRNGRHIDGYPNLPNNILLRDKRNLVAKWILSNNANNEIGIYSYSNIGYIVAGVIIERITDDSWENQIQKRIFNYLNLRSACIGYNLEMSAMISIGHNLCKGDAVPVAPDTSWELYGVANPSGEIYMSIKDLAQYAQFNLKGLGGQTKVLSQEYFELMHKPIGFYGLGWISSEYPSYRGSVHDGSDSGYYSKIFLSAPLNIGIVILMNLDHENAWRASNYITLTLLDHYIKGKYKI